MNPAVVRRNGFVWPADLDVIKASNSGHSFRLLHDGGWWKVCMSFFGGRICSAVEFKGPNGEQWCCADLLAPLGSADWTFRPSRILQPLPTHVEWKDMTRIIPSVEMVNVQTELVFELI